jgi:hypothetical protein
MFIVGHTLIWHRQTPDWVFAGVDGRGADRDTLLARMRSHIQSVVGRYRGRIHGWDVVNEAFEDDGTWRKTPWLLGIGEDYVEKAFEYAREADPGAQLYYNDFNLWKPAKRAAALRLAAHLRRRGLRIDGVGEQGHWLIDAPAVTEIEATILDIARRIHADDHRARHRRAPAQRVTDGSGGRSQQGGQRVGSVPAGAATRRSAAAREAVRRRLRALRAPSRASATCDVLGCDRWLVVAQQLSDPGPDEPPAVVGSRGPA